MPKRRTQAKSKSIGRPPKIINWDEFEKLAKMQCTEEEIAAWFSCSIETIRVACEKKFSMSFLEYFAEKKRIGRISLRRLQLLRAEKGSDTMLVWLGKNMLRQTDKMMLGGDKDNPIVTEVRKVIYLPDNGRDPKPDANPAGGSASATE